MPILDWALRLTSVTVLVLLAWVLVWRKLCREFPFFCSYIALTILSTAVRAGVRNLLVTYFYIYWATEGLLDILALFTLNEVFKHLFPIDYKRRWWFRLVLPVVSVLIAAVFALQPLRLTMTQWIANAIFSFDLGMNCLEALILLLFLLFDKILMAVNSPYDYGIVAGFGISASVTIFADLARSHFGRTANFAFTYVPPIAFIVTTGIWLRAFLRKAPARERLPITLPELGRLLQKRAEFAEKILRGPKLH